jgi:hypothetical protein
MPRSSYLLVFALSFPLLANSYEPSPQLSAEISAYAVPREYEVVNNGFNLEKNTTYVREHNLSPLITNLQKAIFFYLGGSFAAAEIRLLECSSIPYPAYTEHLAGHAYEVTINLAAFMHAQKEKIFSTSESEKAFILVLFHELIHVWQGENLPLDQEKIYNLTHRKQIEGHATFIQGLFAADLGLEALNLRGLAYLLHAAKTQNPSHPSPEVAQNFVQQIKMMHCQGFSEFAALFELYKSEKTLQQRIAKATNNYFTCMGETP